MGLHKSPNRESLPRGWAAILKYTLVGPVVGVDHLRHGRVVILIPEILGRLAPEGLSHVPALDSRDSREKLLGDLRSGQLIYRGLKHRDVQVRFVTPDVAILNGVSDIESSVGGQPQTTLLRFTIVYVKKGGVWLMEAWHAARRPAG